MNKNTSLGGINLPRLFIMYKEAFLNSLDSKTREYVEFLLDESYCNGYSDGEIYGRTLESYNYFN